MTVTQTIKELTIIPGVGKSIATDLYNIGIRQVDDLKGKDPQVLYENSNQFAGCIFRTDVCCMFSDAPSILQKHRQPNKTVKN